MQRQQCKFPAFSAALVSSGHQRMSHLCLSSPKSEEWGKILWKKPSFRCLMWDRQDLVIFISLSNWWQSMQLKRIVLYSLIWCEGKNKGCEWSTNSDDLCNLIQGSCSLFLHGHIEVLHPWHCNATWFLFLHTLQQKKRRRACYLTTSFIGTFTFHPGLFYLRHCQPSCWCSYSWRHSWGL